MKRLQKSAKRPDKMEDQSSEDEDDTLEMERNFALLSKRNVNQTSAEDVEEMNEDDEDESVEEDESPEEDEGGVDEEEDSGSDEDGSDSDPEEEGISQTQSQTEGYLKKELSNMSFEEIMELQSKVGTKAYNKIAFGATKERQTNEPKKRLNKHRPQEISAKKPVPFLRKVVPVKKKISRDPRFDDLSGEYKPEVFNQTYKFINDLRENESKMVRKTLGKTKSQTKKEELTVLLKRLENQQRARQREDQEREKELQFKRKQREMVGQGHKPFYLKKSDKKKMELAEKYSELQKSGKLDNFLSKKRKRNATKDRRKLPNQHKTN